MARPATTATNLRALLKKVKRPWPGLPPVYLLIAGGGVMLPIIPAKKMDSENCFLEVRFKYFKAG